MNKPNPLANINKNQVIIGVVALLFILVSIYIVYKKYHRNSSQVNTSQVTTIKAADTPTKEEINKAAEVSALDRANTSTHTGTQTGEPAEVYETPALLVANNKLRITSLKSSKVKGLPFKDGQNFAKDDILVMFDCKELELDYGIQKAVVKERKLRVDNLKKLQKLNSTSEYSLVEAESLSEQANKLAEKMEYQLANCVIKANYAGKVISTQVTEAEYATAGQDVMTVTNNEDLLVKAYIQASWLSWLKLGTKFKFCFSETNDCFQGAVIRIGAEVDPTSQTIDIFGKLADANPEKLIPGLSAQVTFEKP